jgi:hypothetical protein
LNFFQTDNKIKNGEKCSSNGVCNDLVGLKCSSGVCACDILFLYNGTSCILKPKSTPNCSFDLFESVLFVNFINNSVFCKLSHKRHDFPEE